MSPQYDFPQSQTNRLKIEAVNRGYGLNAIPKIRHKYDVVLVYDEDSINVHFALRPIPGSGAAGILIQLALDYPSVILATYDPYDASANDDDDDHDKNRFTFDPNDPECAKDALNKLIYTLDFPWNFETADVIKDLVKYYKRTLKYTVKVVDKTETENQSTEAETSLTHA